MATELATAYIQVIPSMRGIKGSLTNAMDGEGSSAAKSVGNSFCSSLKKIIAAAGIGKVVKEALTAGGELQQSFGGLDTIYGSAAETMKDFSYQAQQAGISANTYAEQAVSFGAALKQAYGDDLEGAAKAANTAILDMADNSAKMGTSIDSIQNAYQGFAKQNYTMLDNLKLGYGGTKKEMERLLDDAEKLTGIHYDISNLGDVYEAIHVIQGELGLTGVAAAEAKGTFTGSMAAMKAAARNLLADMTLGNDISADLEALTSSASVFWEDNLKPMLKNIAESIPELISPSDLIPKLLEKGTSLIKGLGEGIDSALSAEKDFGIVGSIVESLTSGSLNMGEAALELLNGLLNGFGNFGGTFEEIAGQIISGVKEGIATNDGGFAEAAQTFIANLAVKIVEAPADLLEIGLNLCDMILEGFGEAIPNAIAYADSLIDTIFQTMEFNQLKQKNGGESIVSRIINGISTKLPELANKSAEINDTVSEKIEELVGTIGEKGGELITQLVGGIIENLPQLTAAAIQIAETILKEIIMLPIRMGEIGKALITGLWQGIKESIPSFLGNLSGFKENFLSVFGNVHHDFVSIGSDVDKGMENGIHSGSGRVTSAAESTAWNAFLAAKKKLGIASPSRLFKNMIGKNVMLGFAEGIEGNMSSVTDAINDVTAGATSEFEKGLDLESAITSSVNVTAETDNGSGVIVSAIEKLTNALMSMGITLDSGELVGAISGKIDNSLQQRNNLAMRGGALA